MAEPKKRTNKSKTGMRRMHIKVRSSSIVYCPNCHEPVLKHNVCKSCGFYRGRKIFDIKVKEKIVAEDEKEENK